MTARRPTFGEQARIRLLSSGAEILILENHFNPTPRLKSLHAGPLFAPPDRRVTR